MTHRPTDGAILEKCAAKIDTQSPANRIYVFRCNETGLYAFTADREGCMLPSQMYPQITWQFEYTLLLRLDACVLVGACQSGLTFRPRPSAG